jgi:hypothetical protein
LVCGRTILASRGNSGGSDWCSLTFQLTGR